MQNLIITLVLIVAFLYVSKKLLAVFRPGSSSCGGCCSGCSDSGCSSFPQVPDKRGKSK